MDDTNSNGIPDRVDRVIFGLLTLLTAVGGALLQVYSPAPQWLRVAMVVLPILSGYVALKGRPGGGAVAGLVALLLAGGPVAGAAGCEPFAAAAKATLMVREAGDGIDSAFAEATELKTKECLKKHESKSEGYGRCVADFRKVRDRWRLVVRPSISAAIKSSYTAIRLATLAGAGKDSKAVWRAVKAAVCGTASAIREFSHLFPDEYRLQLAGALDGVEGVTCE